MNDNVCGTYAGYCRHRRRAEMPCPPCIEAKRIYESERRARLKGAGWPNLTHGTAGTYDAGCRCLPCRIAGSERERSYYLRYKARQYGPGGTVDRPDGAGLQPRPRSGVRRQGRCRMMLADLHPETEATPPLPHVTAALDTLRAAVRAVLGPMDHRTLPERRAATLRLRAFAGLGVQR